MERTKAEEIASATIRVAEYVRMSSEHQQYSTTNQSAAIAVYAALHGMAVARTYRDDGRSGLRLQGRPGLQGLLSDVCSGRADFEAVLVYDVSRWGRFQNADEAAHYEFICQAAGVRVVYVAEAFENDGTPFSTVLKSLKRAMAGEYSRELSAKVHAGQARLISLGYRQGGLPGYGLRRMRVDAAGRELGVLERGQHKAFTTDRIVLVPGPIDEVKRVRAMYRRFIAGASLPSIAREMNAAGHLNADGKAWTAQHVRVLLTNTKYLGENVYGKTHGTLHQARVKVPESEWVTCKGAFKAIVPKRLFRAARDRFRTVSVNQSDEEVLAPLRRILERDGYISTKRIQDEPDALSIPALCRRFGGLRHVYARIGFAPAKNLVYADARFFLRDVRELQTVALTAVFENLGVPLSRDGWVVTVAEAWTVSVTVIRTSMYRNVERWYIRQIPAATDVVAFVRMTADGTSIRDFVFWPRVVYGFFPKDVSARACDAIPAYTATLMEALAAAIAHTGAADTFPARAGNVGASLQSLSDECSALNKSLCAALRHASVSGAATTERPLSDAQVTPTTDGRMMVGQGVQVLQFVALGRQAQRLLRDAAFVGWLARRHPANLQMLQEGADRLAATIGNPHERPPP